MFVWGGGETESRILRKHGTSAYLQCVADHVIGHADEAEDAALLAPSGCSNRVGEVRSALLTRLAELGPLDSGQLALLRRKGLFIMITTIPSAIALTA